MKDWREKLIYVVLMFGMGTYVVFKTIAEIAAYIKIISM